MKKQIIYFFLFLFLLADLGYSFVQHLSQPLDGDMAWNIVPSNDVKQVLASPLGIGAIVKHQSYPNPNRFFCHYAIKTYFDIVPLFLQKFVQPIDSVYLSCALVKIILQLSLIMLLATAVTGTFNVCKHDFLFTAVLVTPFFQTEGYQSYMGIIDRSPTYTFFYALPLAFLLLYFLPFFRIYYHQKKPAVRFLIYSLWIPFALVICLSGPLNPGIVLTSSLLLFLRIIIRNYMRSNIPGFYKRIGNSIITIPKNYWFYLLPVCIFSVYSLFLGRFNANNINIPLSELYSRLPEGIYNLLTKKLGFPVLLFVLGFNAFIISRKFKTTEGKKIVNLFTWIGVFALLYILLLPLGGYRENRPNVLRYDTFMPVTLSLIFMFGLSSLFLIRNLTRKQKYWYLPVICGILLLFTINDEPHFDKNNCEKKALKEISESTTDIVPLKGDCNVLSWGKTKRPEYSQLNIQLLTLWKITNGKKRYYNE
jgi:hypothetical protein